MAETLSASSYAQLIVENVREPILVLESDLRVKYANKSFFNYFCSKCDNIQDQFLYQLMNSRFCNPPLRKLLEALSPQNTVIENYEIETDITGLGRRRMQLNARRMDEMNLILLAFEDVTDRKCIEKQMQETSERLQLALEAASLGTWELDVTTGKLFWSDLCKLIFGLPSDVEMSEDKFFGMVHPEDLPELLRAKIRAFTAESGGRFDIEFRAIRPDGMVRCIRTKGRASFDQAGKPRRFIGTALDITESKDAETALRRSESWLRLLTDTAPQIVWTARPDGLRDFWNKQWFEYTGATLEQCAGWKWIEFVHPEDRDRIRGVWMHSVESGKNFETEYRLRRSDGAYRWHLVRAHSMRDEKGSIVHWFGTATDIDDKRRAEEERAGFAAHERERRAEAEIAGRRAAFLAQVSETLTSSLDLVTTMNSVSQLSVPFFADHCIVDILENDRNIRRVAIHHVDPVKCEILNRIGQKYPPVLDAAGGVGAVLRTGRAQWRAQVSDSLLFALARDEEHLELVRQLGLKSFIQVPMLARGRTVGAITFGLTESNRRYNREDVVLAEDLGRRAGLSVDNARLYREAQQALFTAKKAVGARDELLAIVSHDLKNPVNAIKLSAELLLENLEPDSKARRPVETISHSVERMNRLISDLLDIASIDTSTLSITPQSCNVAQQIEQVLEVMQPIAAKNNVVFKTVLEQDVPNVECDPARLVQVLTNLLSNAIKFSPRGGTVAVRAERRGMEVCFSVSDKGIGIPEEQFEHLFDRYWQAETSRTGVGLGLAIAKGIVESHGGQIWVESEVGHGSTFYFTMPLATDHAAPSK